MITAQNGKHLEGHLLFKSQNGYVHQTWNYQQLTHGFASKYLEIIDAKQIHIFLMEEKSCFPIKKWVVTCFEDQNWSWFACRF